MVICYSSDKKHIQGQTPRRKKAGGIPFKGKSFSRATRQHTPGPQRSARHRPCTTPGGGKSGGTLGAGSESEVTNVLTWLANFHITCSTRQHPDACTHPDPVARCHCLLFLPLVIQYSSKQACPKVTLAVLFVSGKFRAKDSLYPCFI